MLILGSLYTLCWVSLIAGVKYRVQRWGGEWDGMMGVANSCNWHFVQGLFIHLFIFLWKQVYATAKVTRR